MDSHAAEVARGERFEFGANWKKFLESLSDERIALAKESLRASLGDVGGLRFLDIGSGSGLFSLAARQLGARVHSFDYDPQSVACTEEVRRRYGGNQGEWTVERGSVLDRPYLDGLGVFDIVYSWGVLHHTGRMWDALDNAQRLVAPGGKLFISIYNDQGYKSRHWRRVKRLYNSGAAGRWAMTVLHLPLYVFRLLLLLLFPRHRDHRGMNAWRDYIDWLGGYPFEVATPQAVFRFFRDRGFTLLDLTTAQGGIGCNEFVFRRLPATGAGIAPPPPAS